MTLTPLQASAVLWIGWLVSWLLAARWSKPVAATPGVRAEARYRLVLIAGAVLFAIPDRHHLYIPGPAFGWAMVGLLALGIAFAWWARIHLGALWSANITRKQDHVIVKTGPYAIVRHPIYTGLILAFVATWLMRGGLLSLAGAALICASFWIKAKGEEAFLRQDLGPVYDAYAARVAMLVPFVL